MEVKESLSLVAKLILDSVGEQKEAGLKTQMGIELFNLAKKELSKTDKQNKNIIDPETDRKIRELKQVEGQGGISWIDYHSWMLLPNFFQNQFIARLDPLIIWQGVFVLKLKLEPLENEIWSQLPLGLSVYELRDMNSFHLAIVGATRSLQYDDLTPLQFKSKRQWFEARCVRSIGNSERGLVIKTREQIYV